jgi:tetratricopeptide (TPR) repeat protein
LAFLYKSALSDLLYDIGSIRLLTYQSLDQAIEFYNQGNEYLETDCQKAIEFYDQAIQANPGLALAWNNKGYALNQLGKFEEAIPVLVQSIQLDRTLVIALNNLGDSLRGLGKNEEAIAAYKESVKLEPENYAAWSGIAECLYNLQEFEKVIEIAGKLIDLDSGNFLGWYVKASCQSRLGYIQPALENLKEAVRLNPEASQELAKTDSDFDQLREDERFQALMESSVGVDYTTLKRYLKGKQWREADQETARLMKEVIQKVINSTEIDEDSTEIDKGAIAVFPCVDLSTIDSLWVKNSDGRFGFSVQKKIYQRCSPDRDRFGNKIGWRIKDADGNYSWRSNSNFDYNSATMPRGHLPSSLWAGEDNIWVENRRDRLIALFARMDSCSIGKA